MSLYYTTMAMILISSLSREEDELTNLWGNTWDLWVVRDEKKKKMGVSRQLTIALMIYLFGYSIVK